MTCRKSLPCDDDAPMSRLQKPDNGRWTKLQSSNCPILCYRCLVRSSVMMTAGHCGPRSMTCGQRLETFSTVIVIKQYVDSRALDHLCKPDTITKYMNASLWRLVHGEQTIDNIVSIPTCANYNYTIKLFIIIPEIAIILVTKADLLAPCINV